MRIIDYSVHPVHVPYKRPIHWGSFTEEGAPIVILRLVSDTGHVGVAESTAKPLWSGVTQSLLKESLEQVFLPMIRNVELTDEYSLDQIIAKIPDNKTAKGVIHSAFWDLRAATAGVPLWKQWGGKNIIEMSWTLSRQAPALMAKEAADIIGLYGFKTIKMKGGQGPDVDYAALDEIRNAVGDSVEIYIDVNQYYDRATAEPYVRKLAERGIKLVEDPYPLIPDDEFRAFQAASPVPILVDTHCTISSDAKAFFASGAQAISLKPGRLGMTEALRCAEIADRHGAKTVIGMFAETDLGTLTNAQLAAVRAANDKGLPAEFSFFLMMREQLLTEPLIVRDGSLHLSETASVSSVVDWDKIDALTLA